VEYLPSDEAVSSIRRKHFPNRYEEPHLRNFFKKVDSGESRLPDLLKHVMIRRTRRHIRKFYSDKDMPIDFPTRRLETVTYDINDVYQTLFDEIKTTLKKLRYARYNLWEYVIPGKREKEPYIQLKKVINTLKVFHKINLFKRLESSIGAFRQSIDNMIDIHKKILAVVEKKKAIPAGEMIQDRLYRYDLEEFWDELDEMIGEYKAEDFDTGRLIRDLRHDIEVFETVKAYLSRIPKEKDAKYDQLLSVVEDLREKKNQRKILIFSEYADTVDYLYGRLEKVYKDAAKIHGGTEGNETKIMAFAPVANDYEGPKSIDLMVASDVLSEGHNLQDCSALINYDLHWNPVRLIQRAGRVDRIGSKADTIYINNFLPTDEVKKEINLQRILERRIKEIHAHIGEDERILTEDERINEEAMYAVYDSKDIDRLEDSDEKDFTQDEAEQIIQNLIQDHPEYMNLIKKMQLGLRSSKTSVKTAGTYAFFRAGEHAKLLMAKGSGGMTDDFSEIMTEIRCNPDEKEIEVNEKHLDGYFNDLDLLKTHYIKLISQEAGLRIDPEVRKAKNRLRNFYRESEHQPTIKENALKIDKTLNAFFPHHLIGQLKNINKYKQDEKRWFEDIINLYNQEKLSDLMNPELTIGKAPTEFICGEIII
jgi:superfamily II DNA/RNA helicase